MIDDPDIIVEAHIYDPIEGEYTLGPVKDALGWVSESNLQKMAESRMDRIFFFCMRRRDERDL